SPDINESAGEGALLPAERAAKVDVLELFFDTGIILHEVAFPRGLPDTVSSFVIMKEQGAVRRAQAGEEPDVEISTADHLGELTTRWLPVPYQLSCPFAVQIFLAETGDGGVRGCLAIDTLEQQGSKGRHLDATLDEGRPFRALDKNEVASFFDHPETRE